MSRLTRAEVEELTLEEAVDTLTELCSVDDPISFHGEECTITALGWSEHGTRRTTELQVMFYGTDSSGMVATRRSGTIADMILDRQTLALTNLELRSMAEKFKDDLTQLIIDAKNVYPENSELLTSALQLAETATQQLEELKNLKASASSKHKTISR